MFKVKFLRNIFLASLAIAIILPSYSIFIDYPSFIKALTEETSDEAIQTAMHLIYMFIPEKTELTENFLLIERAKFETIRKDLNLLKIKVFSAPGKIIYSTDPKDIGKINKKKYFHEVVAKGNTYTKVVKKDTKSLEDQIITIDVVETYVPIMSEDNRFLGAFEIYYDISKRTEIYDRLIFRSASLLIALASGLVVFVLAVSSKTNKSMTERNQLEEKIIHAAQEWRKTFDSITDFVSVHDKDFKFVRVNRALADFLGKTPQELIGKYCYEVFHKTTEPWPYCPRIKTLKSKKTVTEELNDPNIGCPLQITTSPVLDENGEVIETVHIAKDITKQKQMEDALRESEERYRRLVEFSPVSIGVHHNGKWLYVNPAAVTLFGGSGPEDFIGKPILDFVHPDYREIVKERVSKLSKKDKPVPLIEEKLRQLNGKEFYAEVAGMPINYRGKQAVIVTVTNITERKRAEEELRHRQSEISSLYAVSSAVSRTIELNKLLNIIIVTVTGLESLKVERGAGIFIIEGDRMKLVSRLGHSEEFLDFHKNMRVGDCLCGLAAKTGEIIISRDSGNDSRHTIRYSGMKPHGHIIIPLKARGRVIGVLYLYLPADAHVEDSTLKLLGAIGNQIGIALDNAELYEETKKFSLHDPLTGLANRRYMDIVIERNFARAKRLEQYFSVIMLDIDHFKKYNDTYGHTAGDKLLIEIANVISKETRGIDLVIRYGGEEFLVLLPETDLSEAHEAAERIRKAVETETDVTISLGISTFHKGIEKEQELIKKADNALYQAKQKGRNRVELSDRRGKD